MRSGFVLNVLLGCWIVPCGCSTTTQIRVENVSALDFTEVSVGDQDFGDIPAGDTSAYKSVELSFGYAVVELAADGQRVTGQTLNTRAKRFTHRIDIVDLDAGHLAIDIVRE